MTEEMVNDSTETQNTEQVSEQPIESQSAQPSEKITEEKVPEKTFNQYQVNDIVREAKREAIERARREIELERQQQSQSQPIDKTNQEMGSVEEERLRQLINEESERRMMQAEANKVAQEFTNKLMSARDKYADFDDKMNQLDLPSIPHIVQWANSLDNTADVMYEIASHPSKFANILTLSVTAPHLAIGELNKLSASIKQNEAAKNEKSAPEPLGQIKPTNTGTDNGSMSINDFKTQDWLRG